jgi:hypothetical protein
MLRFSAFAQLALAFSLAACSGSDDGSSSSSDGGDTGTPIGDGAATDAPHDTAIAPDGASETSSETSAETSADSPATDTTTGVDGDAHPTDVGNPCVDGSTCSTDFCITDARFPAGYCSEPIAECPAPGGGTDPCPTGSDCVNGLGISAGGASDFCLRECGADTDCRVADGYKCCSGLGHSGHSVCAPKSYCP